MPSPLVPILAVAAFAAAAPVPEAPGRDPAAHDFGKVVRGATVEHVFRIRNPGAATARVARVALTPPLVVTRIPPPIAAGSDGALPVRLDTSGLEGPFEGRIAVFVDGAPEPIELQLRGNVAGPVEISPRPMVVLGAVRGEAKSALLEVVSHEATPLRIDRIEGAEARLTARIETVEKGRRYRLRFTLRPDAPVGRAQDRVRVHTSSPSRPVIQLAAFTNVHERVYTFPDAVDLGVIPRAELARDPGLLARLAQTLMVYQVGGTAFAARFATDVPGLAISAERGPKGDRWQATIRLDGVPPPGPLSGTVTIATNDPEFPSLTVPVHGAIAE